MLYIVIMVSDQVQIPTSQATTIYTAVQMDATPSMVTKPPGTLVEENDHRQTEESSEPTRAKAQETNNNSEGKKPYVAYPDEILAAVSDNGASNNPVFRAKHGTGIIRITGDCDENSNPSSAAARFFCREVYALPRGVLIPYPGTNDYPYYPKELTIGHIEKRKVEDSVNKEIMEWMRKSVAVGLAPTTQDGGGGSGVQDRVTMSHSAIWTSGCKKVRLTRSIPHLFIDTIPERLGNRGLLPLTR